MLRATVAVVITLCVLVCCSISAAPLDQLADSHDLALVRNDFVDRAFTFQAITGIGKESGITRRDPSDIIRVGDTCFVYYTYVDHVKLSPQKKPLKASGYVGTIWYATSEDEGHHWTEQGLALGTGTSDSFDSFAVFTPNIVKFDGQYWLYYTGVKATAGQAIFENNSVNDVTALGVAVADSPHGPFTRLGHDPILSVTAQSDDPARPSPFDSFRIDDAALFVRDSDGDGDLDLWLYYKGRNIDHGRSGPGKTQMGLAIADTPAGPYTRVNGGNPILPNSHEVMIWPHRSGVAAYASATQTLEFAADGLDFTSDPLHMPTANKPIAPGCFRTDLVTPDDFGEGIAWGICMQDPGGPAPYLLRFSLAHAEEWAPPGLSDSSDPNRCDQGVTALVESPVSQGLVYAGTSEGALWVTDNDGVAWTEISAGLPAQYIKSIAPSRFKPSRVYVTLSGIREDEFTPLVYCSEDEGATWTSIVSNLPAADTLQMEVMDSEQKVITSSPVTSVRGFNTFSWDLVTERVDKDKSGVFQTRIDHGYRNHVYKSGTLIKRDTLVDNQLVAVTLKSVDGWTEEASLEEIQRQLKLHPLPLEELNTYERFTAVDKFYPGQAAVGNMHYAPNSHGDYDWANEKYVITSWVDWANNYPDLQGDTIVSNKTTWLKTGEQNGRAHHKWWFSMLPHAKGRDVDGYSHNWWTYLGSIDWVDTLEIQPVENLVIGHSKALNIKGFFRSTKETDISNDVVLTSSDPEVIRVFGHAIQGVSEGTATITAKRDGRQVSIDVTVTR